MSKYNMRYLLEKLLSDLQRKMRSNRSFNPEKPTSVANCQDHLSCTLDLVPPSTDPTSLEKIESTAVRHQPTVQSISTDRNQEAIQF